MLRFRGAKGGFLFPEVFQSRAFKEPVIQSNNTDTNNNIDKYNKECRDFDSSYNS